MATLSGQVSPLCLPKHLPLSGRLFFQGIRLEPLTALREVHVRRALIRFHSGKDIVVLPVLPVLFCQDIDDR